MGEHWVMMALIRRFEQAERSELRTARFFILRTGRVFCE
jgi:hypothetical protein